MDVVHAGRIEKDVVVSQVVEDGSMTYLKIGEKVSCDWDRTGDNSIGGRCESLEKHVIQLVGGTGRCLIAGELVPGWLVGVLRW